jgi:hypothetical protein
MSRIAIAVVIASGVLVAADVAAQMPMPTPGPEHAIFKMDEGVWDATIELTPGPTSTGVETNTLVTDFKGDLMPGMAFHGHGITAWDSTAKKYVGTWTDSMSGGLASMTGTYDAAAKTMTTAMEGRDASGAMVKSRSVSEYAAPDKRVMTMYSTGPDGKEMQTMRVTYTKRK